MRKMLIVILALAIFLVFAEKSLAADVKSETFDVESGFLFGTMRFDGGRPENTGRKFSIGLTTDFVWSDLERGLERILGFRINTIAEPTDGRIQILDDVFAVSGKLRFEINSDDKTIFFPFLGIEGQQWKRNSCGDIWGDLLFLEALFGLGLERDNLYFEVGGFWPFLTKVDHGSAPDGELGFVVSGGLIHEERLKIGLFYRQEKFRGDPGSKLDWYGLSAVYMF